MDSGVSIALIVGCASLTGPLLLNALNSRSLAKAKAVETRERIAEKLEDYRRQDEVAARVDAAARQAAEAAALLLDRDERQAEEAEAARIAAVEVARLAQIRGESTDNQLQQLHDQATEIHGLVNSQLSSALANELAAVVDRVAVMREIINLNKKNDIQPTSETIEALKMADARIKELRGQLEERGS
jgi:hypothetical protein